MHRNSDLSTVRCRVGLKSIVRVLLSDGVPNRARARARIRCQTIGRACVTSHPQNAFLGLPSTPAFDLKLSSSMMRMPRERVELDSERPAVQVQISTDTVKKVEFDSIKMRS